MTLCSFLLFPKKPFLRWYYLRDFCSADDAKQFPSHLIAMFLMCDAMLNGDIETFKQYFIHYHCEN